MVQHVPDYPRPVGSRLRRSGGGAVLHTNYAPILEIPEILLVEDLYCNSHISIYM
jgi:hypothetical protein